MRLQCYILEKELGTGEGPEVDIAVDPLEGTNIVLHAPHMYMEKIGVGPGAAGEININGPVIEKFKSSYKGEKKKILKTL
ncbi:hypothetical protein [Peribacillus muralis]|uniref:hypothetical protein n=1 Tax=Peribacillus muralis TaxID=264697 RepID=UPI00349EE214